VIDARQSFSISGFFGAYGRRDEASVLSWRRRVGLFLIVAGLIGFRTVADDRRHTA